jgi:opine dehydrogenase
MVEVAFAGAGGVGFTGAALLRSLGHGVTLWAPGAAGMDAILAGEKIVASGYINGTFDVRGVEHPQALARSADIIYLAVSATFQKLVIDQLVPFLEDRHIVLCVGANLGAGALYLSKKLAEAGKETKIAVMNGPMIAGRRTSYTECATAPYRSSVKIVGLPYTDTDAIIGALERIYGKRYRKPASENALEVALSALNGVVHAAKALTNITRIEEGLPWCDYRYTTESVSNLTEALDVDRLAVAKAYGFDLPDAVRHFDSTGTARTVQEAMQPVQYQRSFKPGPRGIDTRYIEEELPYSLYVVEVLGQKVGVPTPMLSMMIDIFNATRRKDYRQMHDMAEDTGLHSLDAEETLRLWKHGYHRGA